MLYMFPSRSHGRQRWSARLGTRTVAVLALACLSTTLWAQSAFYGRKAEGWFFYDDPQPPAPPPVAAPTPAPAPTDAPATAAGPAPLSAAWLRENLDHYRERAIDAPTPENVAAYLYLQRVAMDKSSRFAEASQRAVLADPFLDELTNRPIASFGANLANQLAADGRERLMGTIAGMAALWFFYRSDCPYCEVQAPLLEVLAKRYGFHVMAVALDGRPMPGGWFPAYRTDQGQAAQLGVVSTPALFLVRPDATPPVAPVAQGLLSLADLEARIPRTAVAAGWISEDAFRQARPVQGRYAMDTPAAVLPDDPAALVEYLRAQVQAK